MRTRRRVLSIFAAGLAVVVGPLTATASAAPGEDWFDKGVFPVPADTGAEMKAAVQSFSTTHTGRVTGTPAEANAANAIKAEIEALGYTTEVRSYPLVTPLPPVNAINRVVIARRAGSSMPDEEIIFGGHYDTLPQSVDGAYDNASGTRMLMGLAKALTDVPTNRTITFAFFSGEEEGTLSSDAMAADYKRTGRKVAAYLGFDMVGIAFPVGPTTPASVKPNTCLCMWHGQDDDDQRPLLEHVNFEYLKFPNLTQEGVEVRGDNVRNSDEAAWEGQGYRTLRWAGLQAAGHYPEYHKTGDRMDTIYATAGGEEFFEQGMFNTLRSSYYTALEIDNAPPVPTGSAAPTAGGGLTFDATASTDADGPLSVYAWDFGDGSTGSGPTVNHTYPQPGSYTVTLTVSDNRWSTVTRSVEFQVDSEDGGGAAPAPVVPEVGLPVLLVTAGAAAAGAVAVRRRRTVTVAS